MNIITLWLDWLGPFLMALGYAAITLVVGSAVVYGLCEVVEFMTAGWDDE